LVLKDPLDVPAPAGDALYRVAHLAGRYLGHEFATRVRLVPDVARRRELVLHAGAVLPLHGIPFARELQRMAHARAVGVVNRAADLRADHGADHAAYEDCDRPVLVLAHARADHAADDAAEHRAHRLGVAVA